MSTKDIDLQGNLNKDILDAINNAMEGVDFSNVDPDATVFRQLPDGYFLTELETAEFGFSKTSKKLQVKVVLSVVEEGIQLDVDKYGNTVAKKIKGFVKSKIFKYYGYDSEDKILRFANDMVKFEGDTPGESLIDKEAFKNGAEILLDALELLTSVKPRIYVKNDVNTNDDGTSSNWVSLVSWKQAKKLELPM